MKILSTPEVTVLHQGYGVLAEVCNAIREALILVKNVIISSYERFVRPPTMAIMEVLIRMTTSRGVPSPGNTPDHSPILVQSWKK